MENYFIAVLTGHAMPFLRLYQTLILPLQGVTKVLKVLAAYTFGKIFDADYYNIFKVIMSSMHALENRHMRSSIDHRTN